MSDYDPSRVGSYEFDSEYVRCPMCGYQQGDCWEWVTDREQEDKCPGCGGVISYYAEHSVTYYTTAVRAPCDSDSGPQGENSRSEVEGEAPQSGVSEASASPNPSPQEPTPMTDRDALELKSCPFCGQKPLTQPWHGGAPGKTMVSCMDTDEHRCAVAPMVTGETYAEAIAKWNTRAQESER